MKPVRTAAARVGRSLSRLLGGGAVAASLAIHGAGAALALLVWPMLASNPRADVGAKDAPIALDVEVTTGTANGDDGASQPAAPTAALPATPKTPRPVSARTRMRALPFAAPANVAAPLPAELASSSVAMAGDVAAAPVRRFVMSGGSIAGHTAPVAETGLMRASFSPRSGTGVAPLTEEGVDVPATLVQRSLAIYPEAARRADIETDVPLLLTLSAGGTVTEAAALSHPGYGLEEAAVRAARGYLFRPALRAGRPVAVRMRWVIQFRLR